MSEEETTLILIKGVIADMPAADQQRIADCAAQLRTLIIGLGEMGGIAIALVGAEVQADRIDFKGGPHG